MQNRRALRTGIGISIGVVLAGVAALLTFEHGIRKTKTASRDWVQVAQWGKMLRPDAVINAKRELGALPAAAQPRAFKLLNEISAVELSDLGVRSAVQKLSAALPAFADREREFGGEDANIAKVKLGALVVMHGLIERAGENLAKQPQPAASAVKLIQAVREIQLFRRGNSGSLLAEARVGLGPELYDKALQIIDQNAEPSGDKAKP